MRTLPNGQVISSAGEGAFFRAARSAGQSGDEFARELGRTSPVEKSLALARKSLLAYCIGSFSGFKVGRHHRVIADALERVSRGELKRLIIEMPPRMGKLIADETPVLTTEGWKTHGELQPGDFVFGIDGKPTKIVAVSEPGEASIELGFSNGEKIKCHPNHEWLVYDRATCRPRYRIIETNEISKKKFRASGSKPRSVFLLPDQAEIKFPANHLPMPPYVLGAWLGDGTSSKPAITHSPNDQEVCDTIESMGYVPSAVMKHKATGVLTTYYYRGKMLKQLRKLGVFCNKHIPQRYKLSSVNQRLELLAGLIDTDGHVDKTGRVRIVTTNPALAKDISDVVNSLGWRVGIAVTEPRVSTSGIEGRLPVFTVAFNPRKKIPTRIPRKETKLLDPAKRRIGIESYSECDPVLGKCIQVAADDGVYRVGETMIATHNSFLASEKFPAWFFGNNPDKRIIFTTYGQEFADRFGRKVLEDMNTPFFKAVFPNCVLKKRGQTQAGFEIEAGGEYRAVGAGGSLTGRGADVALIDDPTKNYEDACSEILRERQWNWYESTLRTRLMPGGAVVIIATRWTIDDLIGRVRSIHANENWHVISFPAIDDDGNSLWPEQFPVKELEQTRASIDPKVWWSLYQQKPTIGDGAIFKRGDFWSYDTMPSGITHFVQSWDTAFGTRSINDYSVCQTWAIARDGYYLVDQWRGRIDYDALFAKAVELASRYRPSLVLVEQAASGQSLIQSLQSRTNLPVKGLKPWNDKKKVEGFVLERDQLHGAAALSSLIKTGKIRFPKGAPWLRALIDEFCAYDGGNSGHDDQVKAAIVFCSYITNNGLPDYSSYRGFRPARKTRF